MKAKAEVTNTSCCDLSGAIWARLQYLREDVLNVKCKFYKAK